MGAPHGSWLGERAARRATTVDGLQVLDGDTLRLPDGDRIRLLGVDTPEVGQPLAAEATAFSRAFLDGQSVTLVPARGERDRYGRWLADVQVPAGSLSEALVSAGLAWVYRSFDERLLALQVRAVEQRRGIHGLELDGNEGPYRVTATAFHHRSCPLPGPRRGTLPLEQNPGCLFKMGLSPCRRCLPWPPASAQSGGRRGNRPRGSRRE